MQTVSITFTDFGDGKTVINIEPAEILERDIDSLNQTEIAAVKAFLLIRESDVFDHRLLGRSEA